VQRRKEAFCPRLLLVRQQRMQSRHFGGRKIEGENA
jgi:hypothetical protein